MGSSHSSSVAGDDGGPGMGVPSYFRWLADKYPKTLGSGWRDTPEGAKLIKISGGTL